MKHESIREQLALALYGELDATESAEVARHLEGCAECRAFAAELKSGLGAVVARRGAPVAHELPSDWRARIDREWQASEPQGVARGNTAPISSRIAPWWAAAVGFAAGILIAAVLFARDADEQPAEVAHAPAPSVDSAYLQFKRSATPPLAQSGAQLARMTRYIKR